MTFWRFSSSTCRRGLPFFFDKTRGVVKKQWVVPTFPETKRKKAPENGMGLEDEAFLPSFLKGHFGLFSWICGVGVFFLFTMVNHHQRFHHLGESFSFFSKHRTSKADVFRGRNDLLLFIEDLVIQSVTFLGW